MRLANLTGLARPDQKVIKKIIEQSLFFDWIIRVEYASEEPGAGSRWTQWDKTFFALRSSVEILDALSACRRSFPDRSIRLNADKVRPQTSMFYTVYQPEPSRSASKPGVGSRVSGCEPGFLQPGYQTAQGAG